MYRIRVLLIVLLAAFAAACGGRGRGATGYGGEIYEPSYSSGFSIYAAGDSSSVLSIRNPWQGAEGVSMDYFLSRGGEKAPEGFAGQVLNVPLRRVVCLSSSYLAFIDTLGAAQAVKGVSGARYISNPAILERYRSGEVHDVGFDVNLNYELVASLKPDVAFIYGIAGENTAISSKLAELGISVMYIGEYLESDPLGKAEWVVAFGEMFGRREEAERIFGGIAERYEELKHEASAFTYKPKVMLNAPYRDVWFVPGGRSYVVSLIGDAGGEYIFGGDDSSISRPISGEAAYMAVSRADVWLNPNQARTIVGLAAENPKFADIPVVKAKRVYNCLKRSTGGGGSDFWESGALRADRVLEDIITVLHPEWRGGEGETYYFERLD